MNYLLTTSMFIHLVCAALLVGGGFFFRVLLLKYAAREGGLSDELKATLAKRWLHLAMMLLLTLLVTGLYQMSALSGTWKAGKLPGMSPHAIFGVKFLVVLIVFGVVILASVAKSAALRGHLLVVNVVLGFIILLLSAVLSKSYESGTARGDLPPSSAAVQSKNLPSGS